MKFLILTAVLAVFYVSARGQSYYTEMFTSDPGYDVRSDGYQYWDSLNENFVCYVFEGTIDTYASSPEFPAVNSGEDFTISLSFLVNVVENPEDQLVPTVGFSNSPLSEENSFFYQVLHLHDDDFYRFGVSDDQGNQYQSERIFSTGKWYESHFTYSASASTFSITIHKKGSTFNDWEVTDKGLEVEDFSFLNLGKEFDLYDMGICELRIDSVTISGDDATYYSPGNGERQEVLKLYSDRRTNKVLVLVDPDLLPGAVMEIYTMQGKLMGKQNVLQSRTYLDPGFFPGGGYIIRVIHPTKKVAAVRKWMF